MASLKNTLCGVTLALGMVSAPAVFADAGGLRTQGKQLQLQQQKVAKVKQLVAKVKQVQQAQQKKIVVKQIQQKQVQKQAKQMLQQQK